MSTPFSFTLNRIKICQGPRGPVTAHIISLLKIFFAMILSFYILNIRKGLQSAGLVFIEDLFNAASVKIVSFW